LYVDLRFPRKRRSHAACNHAGVTVRPSKGRTALRVFRRSRLFLLLTFVVPVLALAACGGDSGGGSSDESAQQLIDQTFSGKKNVDSGKVNLDLSAKLEATGLASSQLEGPISLKLTGPFQSQGEDKLPEVDFDLTVSAGGQKFTAGAVTTQNQAFISYQGTDYRIPQGQFERYKRQVERDASRNNGRQNQFDLAALGVNPKKWLENPKKEGEEEVGGANTVHVSSDVNIGALLDDLNNLIRRAGNLGLESDQVPQRLSERTKRQIEDSVKNARFDLWSGKDDKIMRRLQIEFSFDLPQDLQDQAQGVSGGTVKIKVEVSDLNKDQTIQVPEKARPLSELQNQLGVSALGLGEGLGGGSGSSGGSSGGGSSGGSSGGGGGGGGTDLGTGGGQPGVDKGRSERYLKCLSDAKRPADIEKCSSILEK
jgi:uncharacterized membrane protein YgcG